MKRFYMAQQKRAQKTSKRLQRLTVILLQRMTQLLLTLHKKWSKQVNS